MTQKYTVLFLLFLFFPAVGIAAPGIEVRGVRIVSDGYGDDMSMRPFNWSKGTALALLVRLPEGGIVSLDRERSSLTSFTDDKGTDLLSKPESNNNFSMTGFGMSPGVSKDGKAVLSEYTAPGLPVAGATLLKLSGKVTLLVATQKETHELKNVALKPQAALSAGPLQFTIEKTGKPDWGSDEYPFAITFKNSGGFESVVSVTFHDSAGQLIASKEGSTMSMTFNEVKTVQQEYQLAREVPLANITIVRWTNLHPVEIPVNLSFGVGIPRG